MNSQLTLGVFFIFILFMKQELDQVHTRIAPYIHRTPIMESGRIENFLGNDLYFKCENFQRAGSVKLRGAIYALLSLTQEQCKYGVVAHSSGNFAQALALAANKLGIKCYLVMPYDASLVKRNAVLSYGGIIIDCALEMESRERVTQSIAMEKGATIIDPTNNWDVILGESTATKEFLDQHPDLQALIVPVGGGSLLSSSILACEHYAREGIEIYGAEPIEVNDTYRSLQMGIIQSNLTIDTMADALCGSLGELTFSIIKKGVTEVICVRENEIISAMRLIWERMKIVVEPSSAVALAALIKERPLFKSKKVGIILSGGNVDLDQLPFADQ